ncbi:MAG: hypothetical protein JW839_22275 [Candidatus Lokiarchaeota archaeon]|nr:hypothetical protein [Candidatus Lokiarchaeota archaeon]
MEPNEFVRVFRDPASQNPPVTGLCGRILRGRQPEDFETMTDDPERKLVMLMASDGLARLVGKSDYDALLLIGYEKDYIKHKMEDGYEFKLVVFKEGGAIKLATWDNVAEAVAAVYPDARKKLYRRLKDLKRKPFREIQAKAGEGYDLDAAFRRGPSDPGFMTYERLKAAKGSLVDVRAFLFHAVQLRALFSGDGYTYDEDGTRGLKEYIAPNKRLDDLGEHAVVDLHPVIPLG